MYGEQDECPFCGAEIMKGAMKCLACGKYLQTDRKVVHKEEKKKISIPPSIQLILILVAAYAAFRYFEDEVMGVWQTIRNALGF